MIDSPQSRFPAERVLIGVSGAIAAVVIPPGLVWMRQALGIGKLRVVMTRQAAKMVLPSVMSAVSGHKALVDWDDAEPSEAPHVALASWAQVIIVMPASANTLSKIAQGRADDLLSTCILAAECPVILAPGMNRAMWEKPATRRNIAQLRADGYHIVEPTEGFSVAQGEGQFGAMADVPTIAVNAYEHLISLGSAR